MHLHIGFSVVAVPTPFHRRTVCGYLLALMVAIAGCGSGKTESSEKTKEADKTKGGDGGLAIDQSTPQAVAESYRKAFAEGDGKTLIACIPEDSRGKVVQQITMLTDAQLTFMIRDPQKRAAFAELLKKHGIGKDRSPKVFEDVKDKGALLTELFAFAKKNPPPKSAGGMSLDRLMEIHSKSKYANFKIEGDTATADVIAPGMRVGMIDFKKVDGKWYNDLAATDRRRRKRKPTNPKAGS